jgi:excinuclease ABC subunit C
MRPRFGVQPRGRQVISHILITGDQRAPPDRHRGVRPGRYFGPFASAGAVSPPHHGAAARFLIRSCTDGFFESRTRPACSHAAPALHRRDRLPSYTELVREANDFLSGRSHLVK